MLSENYVLPLCQYCVTPSPFAMTVLIISVIVPTLLLLYYIPYFRQFCFQFVYAVFFFNLTPYSRLVINSNCSKFVLKSEFIVPQIIFSLSFYHMVRSTIHPHSTDLQIPLATNMLSLRMFSDVDNTVNKLRPSKCCFRHNI